MNLKAGDLVGSLGRIAGHWRTLIFNQIVLEDPTPLSAGCDFDVLSPGAWRVSDQETKRALILAGLG